MDILREILSPSTCQMLLNMFAQVQYLVATCGQLSKTIFCRCWNVSWGQDCTIRSLMCNLQFHDLFRSQVLRQKQMTVYCLGPRPTAKGAGSGGPNEECCHPVIYPPECLPRFNTRWAHVGHWSHTFLRCWNVWWGQWCAPRLFMCNLHCRFFSFFCGSPPWRFIVLTPGQKKRWWSWKFWGKEVILTSSIWSVFPDSRTGANMWTDIDTIFVSAGIFAVARIVQPGLSWHT